MCSGVAGGQTIPSGKLIHKIISSCLNFSIQVSRLHILAAGRAEPQMGDFTQDCENFGLDIVFEL